MCDAWLAWAVITGDCQMPFASGADGSIAIEYSSTLELGSQVVRSDTSESSGDWLTVCDSLLAINNPRHPSTIQIPIRFIIHQTFHWCGMNRTKLIVLVAIVAITAIALRGRESTAADK